MLYLIKGKIDFLRKREINLAVDEFKKGDNNLNVDYLPSTSYIKGKIFDKISPSLFGDAPIVVVESFDNGNDQLQEDLLKILEDDACLGQSLLILEHKGGVKGRKIINLATKKSASGLTKVIETPDIKWDNQKIDFVVNEFRKLGFRINQEAASKLVDSVGEDISELYGYIKQISNDVDENEKVISSEIITRYFEGHRQVEIFNVVDTILSNQKDQALMLFRLYIESGGAIQALVGVMYKKFETLVEILLIDSGKKVDIKMNPYVMKVTRPLLNKYSPQKIAKSIEQLHLIDLASKGGDSDGGFSAFEKFIVEL